MINKLNFKHLGADFSGGLTAAIISLPLALAFGVASGAGAQAGLYGAVCVGLFAALFGGSTRLISEPTGPMTVVMTSVIASLMADYPEQGLAMAFTVVMVAGLFQIVLGLLKLGPIFTIMPYSVISGFMSGIGVILIVLQIPPLLGQSAPGGGVPGVLGSLPELLASLRPLELSLGASALAVLLLFPSRWRRYCPPQLAVLLVGTLVSVFWLDPESVRRIGEIPMGLPRLYVPTFSADQVTRILLHGLVLGTLGAIDTLLTAMIADSLTRDYHDSNKELIGQGIGNLVSGFCGGLPGAGATMGTVVSIQAGAKSILAGVIRAVLLLIVVLWAAPLTAGIPMAVLSAIALKVGLDILDWSFLKRVHRVSWTSTLIMYAVLFLTVFVDLMVAVGIGVFIANILTIRRLSELQSRSVCTIAMPYEGLHLSDEDRALLDRMQGRVLLFYLSGPVIFGVAKAIAREHAAMKDIRMLILDLKDVPMMGVTVALALENMVLDALAGGARVLVVGARGQTHDRLARLEMFEHEGVSEQPDRHAALELALDWLGEEEKAQLRSTA